MQPGEQFFSLHRQGFVRVAACTPRIAVGDPQVERRGNARADARRRRRATSTSMLFPELGFSAYAIDDLLLQDALLDGVEAGLAKLARGVARRCGRCSSWARRSGATAACTTAAWSFARGRILGVTPKSFLPNYREYYENRWFAPGFGIAGLDVTLAGQTVPFGTGLDLRGRATCRISSSISRSARTSGPPTRRRRRARSPAR